MFESLLTVKYITSKNCFCFLSPANFKYLHNNSLKLSYNDTEVAYMGAAVGGVNDQSIGLDCTYARALNIDENSLVAVSETPKPPTVKTVTITTLTGSDYEVLESLADVVQSTLLEQIRVLGEGQVFVIWIGKSIHVTVSVCDINPISPGQLDNLTEVVIKPYQKEYKVAKKEPPVRETFDFLTDYQDKDKSLILRLVPLADLKGDLGALCTPFTVFVVTPTTNEAKVYSMKLLDPESEKSVHVRVYLLQDVLPSLKLDKICSENIFASEAIIEHFGAKLGARVLLEPYRGPLPDNKELGIYAKRNYSIDTMRVFQQYLADNCQHQDFVISSDVVFEVDTFRCFVRFLPCDVDFCLITSEYVRNCKLAFYPEGVPGKDSPKNGLGKFLTGVGNYQEIIDKSVFLFVHKTQVFSKMCNVLVTGKSGTGKSTLLQIIANRISSFPFLIHTKTMNCKTIKGKTVESLHKLFTNTFYDLIHHQPAVLILDDLHILCESVTEGDGLAQQAVYFNRVSEMLERLLKSFGEDNAVGVLVSSESTSKLHKNIYTTRGRHLFKDTYSIDNLARNDRRKLLEFFFVDYEFENTDLERLAEKTESFVMQDLVDLANKTLFESYQEDPEQKIMKITNEHLTTALEAVTETSLAGANLHPHGEKNLDDIGGLVDAKKLLIETMLWPAKYPDLFSHPPLRLASGLLLYGAPGTGKTLLAGAAAKHCGLRLISIKGPELLSKYIGASEQAVRDVFQRAQSAKPCVLFFDEFDSLAPRRGHDNTGVTDRVVNQLLTQLDGIESLSGVFVVAATSRPDLLDPALLRPGRLDIHICCTLPDQSARLDILGVLSKHLTFSADVDLEELSKCSEGFSGADLQAVLYSAQLDSVKDILEKEAEQFQPAINQVQLMDALRSTRPSLSKSEQAKYEQIYRKFEGGGGADFTPGSRATLA